MSNYFGKWSISNGMSNHRGKWNVSKLSLRCLSFIFSIIMIGFSTSPGANVTTPFDVVVPAWYLCLPLVSVNLFSISFQYYTLVLPVTAETTLAYNGTGTL